MHWKIDREMEPDVSMYEMIEYGYKYPNTKPLRKDQAKKLFDHLCIYALYEDNTEAVIHTMEDIEKHDGMFGVYIKTYRNWQLKGLFKGR
jgi:hemoglobin-like flavoprotein